VALGTLCEMFLKPSPLLFIAPGLRHSWQAESYQTSFKES